MASREETIARAARDLGFVVVGTARLEPLAVAPFIERWLAEGRAGEMAWLARRKEERLDPRRAMPWARSVVSLGHPYRPPSRPPADWRATLRGRIAAYAVGEDYHDRLARLLRTLATRLAAEFPGAAFRDYVDTGPVLEREWARRAGIGWIGRNTLVLDRAHGSYLFLAELFTDLALESAPPAVDHCGTCMRCHAACPTDALGPGYTMDPRRCISYLTIEHRGPIPIELRPALDNWIFGCDVCQEVCPWNGEPAEATAEDLMPHLPSVLALDEPAFRARFGKTAVSRAKRRGLLRNVAVALGNTGNPDAVPHLVRALEDAEPLVRRHAAWALGRLGGHTARRSLESALPREEDPETAREIDAALSAL
jgi:epoxyqueuosine reductase